MKTILVPTDFSAAADNAVEYAAHLSRDINASILLLHVYHMPMIDAMAPNLVVAYDDLQKLHEKKLKSKAHELEKKHHIRVKHLAKMGFAVDEIIKEEENADLIVMGMRGAGAFSETVFGSISTDTMRKTHKPILVIPQNAEYQGLKHVVFACDYDSKTNLTTLDYLKDLVSSFRSKIYVVNVIKKEEVLSFEKAVTGIKLENKLNDVEHSYSFLENNDLVKEVNDFAHNHNADMIAIIPHRHNLVERLFNKSNSKKMAFHTDLPLLALPDNHKTIPVYAL